MVQRLVIRHGTESDWLASSGILALGELGYATDTLTLKIGDGNSTWANLDGIGFDDRTAYAVIDDSHADFADAGTPVSTLSSQGIHALAFQVLQRSVQYTDLNSQGAQLVMVDQAADGTWPTTRPASVVVYARGSSGRTDVPTWLTTADQYQARS